VHRPAAGGGLPQHPPPARRLRSRADAIHPGYGFLSENARFAEILEEHNITFIGPTSEHIRIMGDKIEAKETAKRLGIPVVPGSDGAVTNEADAKAIAKTMGYPVLSRRPPAAAAAA
jgi:acetyl-CoA carboxylase biotin carboxylase subunit